MIKKENYFFRKMFIVAELVSLMKHFPYISLHISAETQIR